MNKKEIAMRIKELREDRNIHQKEVAMALGISQPAYCDKENGHTAFTAVELDKLAEFHGKNLDDLLHGGKYVLHMHDQSSNAASVHNQYQHGLGEDAVTKLFDLFASTMAVLERISEQQSKVIELLTKQAK